MHIALSLSCSPIYQHLSLLNWSRSLCLGCLCKSSPLILSPLIIAEFPSCVILLLWLFSSSTRPRIPRRMFYSPVYLSPHISVAHCEFFIYVHCDSCFCLDKYPFPEPWFLFVCLIPEFLFPGVLCISGSLVICFPVGFLFIIVWDSLWPLPPCSIQSPCVLVLDFYMLNVILTSRLRPWFVFWISPRLDLPLFWPLPVFDSDFCLLPNKSLFSLPLPCAPGSFPTHPLHGP